MLLRTIIGHRADEEFHQQRKWSWLHLCLKAKPQLNRPVWVQPRLACYSVVPSFWDMQHYRLNNMYCAF